jgi:hypothetical protein
MAYYHNTMDHCVYTIDCQYLTELRVRNHILPLLSQEEFPSIKVSGDSPWFIVDVLDAIARSPKVKALHIENSGRMGRDQAAAVARVVMRVADFSIYGCVFTPETCGIIARAIRTSPTLVALDLGSITCRRDVIWFAEAMCASETCRSLTISGMGFSVTDAQIISSSFSRLTSLDMSGIDTIKPFVAGIASATELESLTIFCHTISAADAHLMCDVLRRLTRLVVHTHVLDAASFCAAIALESSAMKRLAIRNRNDGRPLRLAGEMTCLGGLEELDLDGVSSDSHLARAIAESKTLRKLKISGQRIDFDAAISIVNAVAENGGMKELDISIGNCGDTMIYALAAAVSQSPHLEFLSLGGSNFFSRNGVDAFAKAVATRWRLVRVSVSYTRNRPIEKALERSKQNAKLLAFCGGLVGPRTPVREFLRKTGDHAVEHRVLGFLAPTT